MPDTGRSLLHRTATAVGWWASSDRASGEPAPLAHTVSAIAETAVEGGYSAGLSLGVCLPIKPPFTAVSGRANLETETPVHSGTLFRVGACTRQFTAAAILLLAERNRLKLTDRIGRFLPHDPAADRLRVGELMTGDSAAYARLGRIVEHVASGSLADFVTDNLLLPAGMETSRFADATQITPHRASGYRLAADRAHDFCNCGAGHGVTAADGLHTNAAELLLWNRALYNGRLLSPSAVELMTVASAESAPCPILAPFLDRHGRGYGLEVGRIFGRRAYWQRGQAPGYDTWLFHFPDDRADLALLANTEQGAATVLEPMLRALLRV